MRRGRGYRVEGRCLTVGAWAAIQRISLIAVVALGLAAMGVATVGWWAPKISRVADGTFVYGIAGRAVSVRLWLGDLLANEFAEFDRAIRYDPTSPIDWHLGALSLALWIGCVPIARLAALLATILLRPIVVRRFRITIAQDRIRVGRGLLRASIPRDDNGPVPVRFRVATADEYYSRFRRAEVQGHRLFHPLAEMPPAVVEISHGYRRRRVLFARRIDRAEAIVARCNEAMLRTTPTLPHLDG
ncbi:MAG: hypothetical protein AAFX79_13655 [Planctomycetota bacterium]